MLSLLNRIRYGNVCLIAVPFYTQMLDGGLPFMAELKPQDHFDIDGDLSSIEMSKILR
jgi:hypothetical protein